ncbi:MAG: SRPBCC family protein [Roseiflexaceae bacterium]
MEQNRIEKHIDLKAPISRVWKALTDHNEFGQWFGVTLEAPFVVGTTVAGKLTYAGFEHMHWAVDVQKIEPERLFAFTWHPYAVDVTIDYAKETPTLVEFTLAATSDGTHLVVTESGFETIPANRRLEAFRMDEAGWIEQLENIANYVG